MPGAISRIGTSGRLRPSGPRSTTPAPSISCPSRKTVALTWKDSPGTARAGRSPRARRAARRLSESGRSPRRSYPAAAALMRSAAEAGPLMSGPRRTAIRVAPVRAIRRFTIQPRLPEQLAPLRGLMLNLRWSWHAETLDLFASIDPAGWSAPGASRSRCWPRSRRSAWPSWPATGGSCGGWATPSTTCATTPPARAGTRPTRTWPARRRPWPTSRPSTASPRRCRSTRAALASWPAIT